MKNQLPLLILFIISGCYLPATENKTNNIAIVMKEAESNSKEIQKAITYFRNDTAKLNALYYVLYNLSGRKHVAGALADSLQLISKEFHKVDTLGYLNFKYTYDSILASHPGCFTTSQPMEELTDLSVITADILIQHINASFKSLQYTWAKSLTREDFYRYLLPLKFSEEPVAGWKQYIQHQWKEFADTLTARDSYSACIAINNRLKKIFCMNKTEYPYDIGFFELHKFRCGFCSEATKYAAYIMNALGVPVTLAFTPAWANKNGSHYWNILHYQNKMYPFMGSETNPGADKISFTRQNWIRRKRAKVYERSYSETDNPYWETGNHYTPAFFKNHHLMDITATSVPSATVTLRITPYIRNAALFACVFCNNRWEPVDIGKTSNYLLFQNANFKDIGCDIVYLPCFIAKDESQTPAHAPFIIHQSGEIRNLIPDSSTLQTIVLKRKYPEDGSNRIIKGNNYELFMWNNEWVSAGKQTAQADSLIYQNMPSNTLFWLRNTDKGIQDRIFTYENNKQIWW